MALLFEIYRNGERATSFMPVAPYAVGPESVPIPGEVAFRDGMLIVTPTDNLAAGVALLWDAGDIGSYHLETTRLPQREAPYILNIELARFRLMKIVQKQEDWNLFDFPRAEKFAEMFRQAQSLFAEALGSMHEPEEAAILADRSLAMAIDLSEQLAMFHADLLLNRRRSAGAFVKHIIGVRVNSSIPNEKYKETAATGFDYVNLPMSWRQLQPEEQAFNTESIDQWVEFLSKKRTPIIAGPLVNLAETEVPDWMFIWEHDFDTLRELAYEYTQKVIGRYRRAVGAWNVCAGLHTNSAFTLSFEQMIELTRLLVSQAKTLMPNCKTLVTITQPFGEYHSKPNAGVAPMLYAEMLSQSGINFEAYGLQLEMGVPTQGSFTRDLFQLSCMLDKFSTLGRPVYLTGMCVPGRNSPDPADLTEGGLDPSLAGRWHKAWEPEIQAEWMDQVYKLAMSKPYVESIAWGNLADLGHTVPGGGLLDDMLKPKASYEQMQELRERFKQWHQRKGI